MIDRDTIIRMAREVADPNTADVVFDDLITLNFGEMERFAALVAATERKAIHDDAVWCVNNYVEHLIPERIRARSNT